MTGNLQAKSGHASAVLLHSRATACPVLLRAKRPAPATRYPVMIRHPRLRIIASATAFALTLAPAAQAQVALNQNEHINEQLMAAAVGDVIRKTCPTISARMFTVYRKARALESYARDQGYTEEQVDVFLDDRSEKDRIKGMAADYMAANGVVSGDVESYCRLGRDEIAKGSLIGSLLRED